MLLLRDIALLLRPLLPSQPAPLLLLRLLASLVLILWCRRRVSASAGCFHRPKSFAMSKTATTGQHSMAQHSTQRSGGSSTRTVSGCRLGASTSRRASPCQTQPLLRRMAQHTAQQGKQHKDSQWASAGCFERPKSFAMLITATTAQHSIAHSAAGAISTRTVRGVG
jgi:hypothetical protein